MVEVTRAARPYPSGAAFQASFRNTPDTSYLGYKNTIQAAATEGDYLGWVSYRSKKIGRIFDDSYRLELAGPGLDIEPWELPSYNPFFGCFVEYMAFYAGAVVVVYREKHKTLVARMGPSERAVIEIQPD